MKRTIFFILCLLYAGAVHAGAAQAGCLVDGRADNKLMGKVTFIKYGHPTREDVSITGYVLVLPSSICVEIPDDDGKIRGHTIQKIQLIPLSRNYNSRKGTQIINALDTSKEWAVLHGYLKDKVGKHIKVWGTLEYNASAYYVHGMQIAVIRAEECRVPPARGSCD